ncbi:MAG: peptidylprolyl isomerase [Dehalococcoidales bacterium]|nr:peptidylprolyl isomerase [Dehalococcoidales bacterium]
MNKTPAKRKMTHVVREKKRKNFTDIIKFAVFTVIAIVVGLVGVGIHEWYKDEYKPMHETVIDVNGTKFDMTYYVDMLRYVSGEYYQYAAYFTSYALQYIEYYELIKQGAEELGITVSEKEITVLIKENEYDNTPAARDMIRASLLIPLLEEHFGSQIDASTEHNYVLAMFLESQSQVDAVKSRIASGELFKDIAEELSLDTTTQKAVGDLGWLPKGVIDDILGNTVLTDELVSNAVIGELNSVEDTTKTKAVGYWILKVIERSAQVYNGAEEEVEVATIKAILVGSQELADEVLTLLNNGGDFDELAEEYSQIWDEDDGCVLEVEQGTYSEVFEAFVFDEDTVVNTISEIIRDTEKTTSGGYWLYQVTDNAIRDISEENMEILIGDAMDEWVASFDYDTVIESENIEEMKTFAAAKVSGS